MAAEITPREALTRLGASTAEAVARVLETFAPGAIARGDVTVIGEGASPFANLPFGGVAASVSYVDGVTGANIFIMSAACARALAAAMGAGTPEGETAPTELTELEISAIGEAANQMLAAAAAAISVVIGHDIGISVPDTRVLDDTDQAIDRYGTAPHACSTSFTIAGESCRLVQLVPSAFVVRMARAIDELSLESSPSADQANAASIGASTSVSLPEALSEINLRVWAELGRTQLALGQALELPIGAVVDLDRSADAPVDLFVNGLCFGRGHLLVTEDGEWAIEVQQLSNPALRKPALAGVGVDPHDLTHTKGSH